MTQQAQGVQTVSEDQVQAMAVAVSLNSGLAYQLEIEQFTTSKDDSTNAGTFMISGPLASQLGVPGASNLDYTGVGGPMDIIAIYAARVSSDGAWATSSLGPSQPLASLRYPISSTGSNTSFLASGGQENASTLQAALTSPSCIFIGMVDRISRRINPTDGAILTVTGRDLTKIFIDNDTLVANGNYTAQMAAIQAGADFLLKTYSNPGEALLDLLDLLVSKSGPYISSSVTAGLGYPWRSFIDPSLVSDFSGSNPVAQNWLTDAAFLSRYTVQAGSAWSSAIEFSNAPRGRLFVNEIGQLIFDDQLAAWYAGNYGNTDGVLVTIPSREIRDFESITDDENISTVIAATSSSSVGLLFQEVAGLQYDPNSPNSLTYTTGLTLPTAWNNAVTMLGYRFTSYSSLYINAPEDTRGYLSYLQFLYNNLYFCNVQVRGSGSYRVGYRANIQTGAGDSQTTNAIWYITAIQHAWTFGSDWTTQISGKYPFQP